MAAPAIQTVEKAVPPEPIPPQPLRPFADFREAAEASLAMLRQRTQLSTWMFTRVDGNDWMVLAVSDSHYGLRTGDALNWGDSICSRMLRGDGPQAVADVAGHAPYGEAPIVGRGIGAYLGVPVALDGGATGTLCAIDPQRAAAELEQWLPLAQICAQMLGTLWKHDVDLQESRRRAERAEIDAMTDPMTQVYNRRGWRQLLALEEERCREGHTTAGIVVVDLDRLKRINDSQGHPAGDELIVRAANQIGASVRPIDAVARLGGDEFSVLMLAVGPLELARLAQRIEVDLRGAGIAATVGYSWRGPDRDLAEAYREADLLMLDAKRAKHQAADRALKDGAAGSQPVGSRA
jgi:diguanylate cyclase (GGDEF)-like protein